MRIEVSSFERTSAFFGGLNAIQPIIAGSSSEEDVRPSKAEERPATGKGLNTSDDPLAEFYSQARAEKNNAVCVLLLRSDVMFSPGTFYLQQNRWDLGDENGETTFTEETGKLSDQRPVCLNGCHLIGSTY